MKKSIDKTNFWYIIRIPNKSLKNEEEKQMEENTEKKKALEMAMSQIEKQFGKGSVMKLRRIQSNGNRSNTNRSFES